MGAIGLLILLFLVTACRSVSPALAASSLQGASSHDAASPQVQSDVIAGYETSVPAEYTAATVRFTVPTLTPTVDGAKVAYGAEIGGTAGGGAIIDAGIYSYLDPSGNQINRAYWEFYSEGSPGLSNTQPLSLSPDGVVSPNDQIAVSISWNTSGGHAYDSFFIKDITTNSGASYALTGSDYLPDSTSAGCLVLSPMGASPRLPVADFGTVVMQQCNVDRFYLGGNLDPIGNYGPVASQIVRVDSNGAKVAYTSSPTYPLGNNGQDFSVSWENAQPV
jgi:hypothetical protein